MPYISGHGYGPDLWVLVAAALAAVVLFALALSRVLAG